MCNIEWRFIFSNFVLMTEVYIMDIWCDNKSLNSLMQSFASISSIPISVFDRTLDGSRADSQNMCAFCQNMRKNEAFCVQCDQSNKDAFRVVEQTHAPHLYQCHAGLYELVVPIVSEENLLGYLMIGQFVPTEEQEAVWELVRERCRDYGSPDRETFFSQVRLLPYREIKGWAEMAMACTSHICANQYIISKWDEDFQRIAEFIDSHLSSALLIDSICKATAIPRNRLYETVKRNTGFTVGEYIWILRINKAKELLTDTNLPVSEIAEQLGVEDYNYFTKVFRRIVGISPMQFRKKHCRPV